MVKHFWIALLVTLSAPLFAQEKLMSPLIKPADVRLTQATGDVLLMTRTGDAEGPTVPGDMPLAEGDVIKTRGHATAEIVFDGESLIHLQEWSICRLIHLSPGKVVLDLENGMLLGRVSFEKKKGMQFSVITPNAVTSVREAEFVVQQMESGVYVGVLDEGHVEVAKPGFKKKVLLHFNQETQVQRGRPPEKPHTLQRYYDEKPLMGDIRARLKLVRKHWDALTVEQRQLIRDAWIKTHHRSSRHHSKSH